MAKVIVERPRRGARHGAGSAYPRGAKRLVTRRLEDAPSKERMGAGYTTKYLNENLAPLERWFGAHVGRPWRLVFAELSERISLRSAVQKHILQHLWQIVAAHVWVENGVHLYTTSTGAVGALFDERCRGPSYYVCPRTELLRRVVRPARRARRVATNADRRVLAADRELHRIDGLWFEITMAPMPEDATACRACFDVLARCAPARYFRGPDYWGEQKYAVGRRQLSTRELVAHGLRT